MSDVVGGKSGFDSLKQARRMYSRYMAMRDIERIVTRSEMMKVPATGIQTGFRTLAMNPSRMRAFTQAEKDLIHKAAKTGLVADALSTLGSRLPVIGTIVTGGPAAVAAAQAGTSIARKGAEAVQLGRAGNVIKAISDDVRGIKSPLASNVNPLPASTASASALSDSPSESSDQPTRDEVLQFLRGGGEIQGSASQDFIHGNEGLRFNAYWDGVAHEGKPKGHRTVGHGFNMQSGIARKVWKEAGVQTPFAAVYKGEASITKDEADALFRASFNVARNDARSVYKNFDRLSDNRRTALLDLSYQLGKSKILQFKAFNKSVNNGNWNQAVKHLRDSLYAKQTPNRMKRVASLLLQGG